MLISQGQGLYFNVLQVSQPESPVPGQAEDRDSDRQPTKKYFQQPCLSAILAFEDRQASKMSYVWSLGDRRVFEGHRDLAMRTAAPRWISIRKTGQAAIIQDERLTKDWTC